MVLLFWTRRLLSNPKKREEPSRGSGGLGGWGQCGTWCFRIQNGRRWAEKKDSVPMMVALMLYAFAFPPGSSRKESMDIFSQRHCPLHFLELKRKQKQILLVIWRINEGREKSCLPPSEQKMAWPRLRQWGGVMEERSLIWGTFVRQSYGWYFWMVPGVLLMWWEEVGSKWIVHDFLNRKQTGERTNVAK